MTATRRSRWARRFVLRRVARSLGLSIEPPRRRYLHALAGRRSPGPAADQTRSRRPGRCSRSSWEYPLTVAQLAVLLGSLSLLRSDSGAPAAVGVVCSSVALVMVLARPWVRRWR